MKLYYLKSVAKSGGDLVAISDGKNRISGYFIWDANDGKFLHFTKIHGVAQERLTEAEIAGVDYLECVISVPIFSKKARDIFEKAVPDEFEFHDILIDAQGKASIFYLCKCLRKINVINKQASVYRPLTDGSLILSQPVLRAQLDEDFYIARDRDEPQLLVVSEKFEKLCRENSLQIDFVKAPQQ